jgi:hypothetical protein
MNSQQPKDLRLPGHLKLHSMALIQASIQASARSFAGPCDVTRDGDYTSDAVPSESSRIDPAVWYQSFESRYSECKDGLRSCVMIWRIWSCTSRSVNKTSIGKIIIRARVLGMVFRRRHATWALTKEAADGVF